MKPIDGLMKRLAFVTIGIITCCGLAAQKTNNMTGEYYLRGVMETASGFKLNADSTFQFFFSQGALDRGGSGTWSVKDGTIIFKSRNRPAKDFALLESKIIPGDTITIQIKDNNQHLLRYVDCSIKTKKGVLSESTNSEGIARFAFKEPETIALLFRFCPDRYSVFAVDDKRNNYFSFRFESWIAEVFFDHFALRIEDGQLTGGHPLLEGDRFSYEKN